ncbi:MAG: ANTAR domain-containing response regulator [Gaiellaceae bacterium]
MSDPEHRLQVLIANEHDDRLASITAVVTSLGHEVVGRAVSVAEVGPLSRQTGAEVALVGLGLDSPHALEQISAIVHEAACPVVALLDAADQSYVEEAAKRGVFAYVVLHGDESREIQNALDITLRRFAEFQNLQGAFGRRALIEQAKGILMERHRIDADMAFDMLKAHSQQRGRKLVDGAEALLQSHQLLPPSHTAVNEE